jgi:hypothetical protein
MKTLGVLGLAAAILALLALPASAQPVISAKSGTISGVDGKVFLDDQEVEPSLTKFPDIKENSVLRTTDAGRAEVLLTPGVVMHVGENSSFRMITKRLIDTRLELLTGSAVVSAVEIAKDTNVTIVCKDGAAVLAKAGHYRFDAEPGRLKVFAGQADVQLGDRYIEVTGGKMLQLAGTTAAVEKFDKEDTDSLDNWAQRRDQLMAMANVSSAHSMSYAPSGTGIWGWNPYFGLYTFIPGMGQFCDPFYGYCYWSPYTVARVYWNPWLYMNRYGNLFGGGGGGTSTTAANRLNGPIGRSYSGPVASNSGGSFAGGGSSGGMGSGGMGAGAASGGPRGASGGGHGK